MLMLQRWLGSGSSLSPKQGTVWVILVSEETLCCFAVVAMVSLGFSVPQLETDLHRSQALSQAPQCHWVPQQLLL